MPYAVEGELVEGEVVIMIHESSSCRSFWWQIFMLVYFLGCFFFISCSVAGHAQFPRIVTLKL